MTSSSTRKWMSRTFRGWWREIVSGITLHTYLMLFPPVTNPYGIIYKFVTSFMHWKFICVCTYKQIKQCILFLRAVNISDVIRRHLSFSCTFFFLLWNVVGKNTRHIPTTTSNYCRTVAPQENSSWQTWSYTSATNLLIIDVGCSSQSEA